jgi:hypothetical protein
MEMLESDKTLSSGKKYYCSLKITNVAKGLFYSY